MAITITPTELFLLIAGISIIILMIFLVPLIIQLKQTANRAERLLTDLNRDLPVIMSSAKKTAAEVQNLSEDLNAKVAEADEIFQKIKFATSSFLLTGKLVRSSLAPAILEIAAISTGIKAFLHVIHRSKSNATKEAEENE